MEAFFGGMGGGGGAPQGGHQRAPQSEFARSAYQAAFQQEMMAALGVTGLNFGGQMPPQQPHQPRGGAAEATEDHAGAPPVDEGALGDLPVVRITEADLVQDGNDECCICLEEQKVGDRVTKLPCGHLYHGECIAGWLRKHGTCPNCRYELKSSDARFEAGRGERMRERVPRFRRRALEALPVRELRRLAAARALDVSGVSEKSELVRRLVDGGAVRVVAEDPPRELDESEAEVRAGWSVKQLKKMMAELGVDSTRCLDKADLVAQLRASGRVVFRGAGAEGAAMDVSDAKDEDAGADADAKAMDCDEPEPAKGAADAKGAATGDAPDRGAAAMDALDAKCDALDAEAAADVLEVGDGGFDLDDAKGGEPMDAKGDAADAGGAGAICLGREELEGLSVRRLKQYLERAGLAGELRGCCDKGEMRRALANAPNVRIRD